MKRFMLFIPIIAAVLAVVLLAGCDAFAPRSSQPLPTVVLDATNIPAAAPLGGAPARPAGGEVRASGNIAPAQQIQLAFSLGGTLLELNVKEGDTVRSGQMLARLAGVERYNAAVQAANLELLSAQQALKSLQDQAATALSAAQVRLANAQKSLDDAQKRREWRQYRNGSQSQIDAAQADVILANDALKRAEEMYSAFAAHAEDDVNRAAALSALSAARRARDRAVANLNYLLAMPDPIELAKVEAELFAAKTEFESAQKEVNKLKKGPDPDALALLEQRIQNAKAQLSASQVALTELELKAPMNGTVARLRVRKGEAVLPNQPVLTLVDLEHMVVETSDLSERDISKIFIGQKAVVYVKAIRQTLNGNVASIAPLADTLGGDVVYRTTVELERVVSELRAGMSVEVQFIID